MAETITLSPGSKVRQDGATYRVVDTASIEGELIEVKAQKNRHLSCECTNEDCRAKQMEKAGRLVTSCRVSDSRNKAKYDAWPACGWCGTPMPLAATTEND